MKIYEIGDAYFGKFLIFSLHASKVFLLIIRLQNVNETGGQWWILGEANEAVASAPPLF